MASQQSITGPVHACLVQSFAKAAATAQAAESVLARSVEAARVKIGVFFDEVVAAAAARRRQLEVCGPQCVLC